MTRLPGSTFVTVCACCLRACCWHGEFMCDEARNAGITERSVDELDRLNLEHRDNYSQETIERIIGVRR